VIEDEIMEHEQTARMLSTKEKALQINLATDIYGSFGEIGAGQEVSSNFYRAGGASGTMALSLSAYDMKISDFIYGECDRYVTESRLTQMMNFEYRLITKKLVHRAAESKFFTYSNTVEVLNYRKTNKGHGWMGIRFQLSPNSEPNECVIHCNLLEHNKDRQQHALGVLGVNLIYGCYFLHKDPVALVKSLLDDLDRTRVEIDMFRISGPDFESVDNRLLALELVKSGLTDAALFGPKGNVQQASSALYKKNILVNRGRFRPATFVNIDMLNRGLEQFQKENDVSRKNISVIFELTLKDLQSSGTKIDERDFLDRVDILGALGHTVLISNYVKYYKVAQFLAGFTRGRKIGVLLGIRNLATVFDESYYENLAGGILEAFGTGFGHNVKLYVYPTQSDDGKKTLQRLSNFKVADNLVGLLKHMQDNNKIDDIIGVDPKLLSIYSDNVLDMIKNGESGWEKLVPEKVADIIKQRGLFHYSAPKKPKKSKETVA